MTTRLNKVFGTTALAAVMGAGLLFAGDASAAILSFDDGVFEQDGVINHTAGGVVTGSEIDFDSISGMDTPLNAGSANALDCVNCELRFTSGPLVTQGNVTTDWKWGAGGSITVTGSAELGDGTVIASGTLLSGSFTSTTVTAGNSTSLDLDGFGFDEKAEGLLEYFGITDNNFIFSNTKIALGTADIDPDGSFTGEVTNADLDNRAIPAPEPATLLMVGTGLLAAGGIAARRRRSAA